MRRAFVLTGVVAAVLITGGCDGDEGGDGVFDEEAFPFTFEYPEGFSETGDVTIEEELGGEADEQHAVIETENDGIFLQLFTLNIPVDESNLNEAKREFEALVGQVDSGARASPTEVAGLPALEFEPVPVPSIAGGESRFTFLFQGDQEYVINCQSTPDGRQSVAEACDQALETIELK